MAAFNTIVVGRACPACDSTVALRFQTHVASDFGGDETGRFCLRDYGIGERMAWWPRDHPRFRAWQLHEGAIVDDETVTDACYGACDACRAELFAVIRFVDVTPVSVDDVGLEKDWPLGFSR